MTLAITIVPDSDVAILNAQGLTGRRQPVSAGQLIRLVSIVVKEWTRTSETFTAWDVTNAIRTQFPGLEIEHEAKFGILGVRGIVHDAMHDLIQLGVVAYSVPVLDYDGNSAKTYVPNILTATQVTVTSTPTPTMAATTAPIASAVPDTASPAVTINPVTTMQPTYPQRPGLPSPDHTAKIPWRNLDDL